MNKDLSTVLRWAREQTADGLGAPARVVEAIDRLTARKVPRLPRVKAPGKSADDRRKERNERAAAIRAEVFKRANGRCECCCSRTPAEWHHVIGGGARRAEESVETTAAVCVFCHVDLHRSRFHALVSMRRWAMTNGFADALHAIERRIDKGQGFGTVVAVD